MRFNFIICCWFIAGQLYAQDFDFLIENGDYYYGIEQYNSAIDFYREAIDQGYTEADVLLKLADSHLKIFDYKEAEVYYQKLYYNHFAEHPTSLYYLGQILKHNGYYTEAIEHLESFISKFNDQAAFKQYVEQAARDLLGAELALKEEALPLEFNIHQAATPLNSTFNDYAPAVMDSSSLMITSGRINSMRLAIDDRYGEAFSDNFYFKKKAGRWEDHSREVKLLNTRFNDGSGSYSRKNSRYYYTRCSPQCEIYVASYNGNKWQAPTKLNENINIKGYESKQPAVTRGGDTLLFVSNRPGGYGLNDIWMSTKTGPGEAWGVPKNMGPAINTSRNDISPATTMFNNTIFFASEGHISFGGLDLFMAKRLSSGDTLVYNLGTPFNTSYNDAFATMADNRFYWSSNREGGQGNFDIYYSTIRSEISFLSKIAIKRASNPGDNAIRSRLQNYNRVQLIAETQEDIIEYDNLSYDKQKIADAILQRKLAGRAFQDLLANLSPLDHQQVLQVAELMAQQQGGIKKFDLLAYLITTHLGDELTISGQLFDTARHDPLPDHQVHLKYGDGITMKSTHTNGDGRFYFASVRQESGMYLEVLQVPSPSKVMLRDLKVVPQKIDKSIATFENIYFDYDHYTLRPEAQTALKELARYLKANKEAQVEVVAHADSRGSLEYNLLLSDKRGRAVVGYLREEGVDATNLSIVPQGYKYPVASNSDELGRQLNRRVEFFIKGNFDNYQPKTRTVILKKAAGVKELSRITGVAIETLQKLNGLIYSQKSFKAYEPVRLPMNAETPASTFFN